MTCSIQTVDGGGVGLVGAGNGETRRGRDASGFVVEVSGEDAECKLWIAGGRALHSRKPNQWRGKDVLKSLAW
jgi:hypothetical protein